ncbi:hypothetical protein LTR50_004880 [Elasticomyces elasticus]|nr:hypothetical protein LTR50_004880 [Elasticomyces elasticus]
MEGPSVPEAPTPSPTQPTSASALSAAAAPFSPTAVSSGTQAPTHNQDVSAFAQTDASQEQLFDKTDYATESMQTRQPDAHLDDDFTPISEPIVEAPLPPPTTTAAPARATRVIYRGRGRGNFQGRTDASAPSTQPHQTAAQPTAAQAPSDAPAGPRTQNKHAPIDRSTTGGVRKPKLTDAELAEKMKAISIKNASLVAAHERAEADAAMFAQREVEAEQRRTLERRDRQQMMGERERNRDRKLKTVGRREWDAKKEENDGPGGENAREAVAGPAAEYQDGREYIWREDRGNARARGEGRGRYRGFVRGRGGAGRQAPEMAQAAPVLLDFPALPLQAPAERGGVADTAAIDIASWADQVEASTAD